MQINGRMLRVGAWDFLGATSPVASRDRVVPVDDMRPVRAECLGELA
jgi:hypothetical protein